MAKYNIDDNDKYLIENNKLQIQGIEELEAAEALAFSIRSLEIERDEYMIESFELKNFMKLHHHLFQDIYHFAGEFRDVQLIKGTTRFCQFQYINSYAERLFEELNKEKNWHSLEDAASRLAYFKSELNMLHPYREGNGRTIRTFIYFYAKSKGIYWAYDVIDQEQYLQAMILSVTNLDLLKKLFKETIYYFNECK